jgi:FlaG/FlaF family flagellin (archaellin)
MNRLNKKAVSAVVATVLIIMITVAAVGIIWAAIIPMVQKGLTEGTICNDALSDVTLVADGGHTCIDSESGNISLQIRKGPNAKVNLVAVDALIFVDGNSFGYRINESNNSGNVTGTLPTSNLEKKIIISDISLQNATKVKIAAVVAVGETQKTCDAASEVILGPCTK